MAYPANNHPRFSEIDSILIGLRLESSPHSSILLLVVLVLYIYDYDQGELGGGGMREGFYSRKSSVMETICTFLRCSMVHFLSFKAISIVI